MDPGKNGYADARVWWAIGLWGEGDKNARAIVYNVKLASRFLNPNYK